MRLVNILLLMIVFLFGNDALANNNHENDSANYQEFIIRNGLPNFFLKCLKGDSVKIAYFGGSITAQKGWRVYSLDWLKELYPKAKFTEINASIGGTGSDFGAYRLKDHVLKYQPDLVFVEFVVNDRQSSFDAVVKSMEGIVRQIKKDNPQTEICFIYTIRDTFLQLIEENNLPQSYLAMEKVAEHYGIPSINFGREILNRINSKQLLIKGDSIVKDGIQVFSPDGVHPYIETGHQIYAQVFKRAFQAMEIKKATKIKKHNIPNPISSECLENAVMIDLDKVKISSDWKKIETINSADFSMFSKLLDYIISSDKEGAALSLKFKGKAVGVYDIMGPDAGRVVVEIDGISKDTIFRFDEYCTYRRIHYFLIDNLEDREHTVVFRLLSDPFDKALILSKMNNVMRNPEDYKQYNWYVGKILINGTLTDYSK